MALARLGRQAKRPYGFCAKITAVGVLGLCFIVLWTVFSSSSTSVTVQRESFDDIGEPASGNAKVRTFGSHTNKHQVENHESSEKVKFDSDLDKGEKKVNASVSSSVNKHKSEKKRKEIPNKIKEKEKIKLPERETGENNGSEESENEDSQKEEEDEEGLVVDGKEQALNHESEASEDAGDEGAVAEKVDQESEETLEDEGGELRKGIKKTKKIKGPVFDPKVQYNWKLCNARSKHNYIPCVDFEVGSGKLQSYRHTERSCPRTPPMCLVPLLHAGYGVPVRWPESKVKVYLALYPFSSSELLGDAMCSDVIFGYFSLFADIV